MNIAKYLKRSDIYPMEPAGTVLPANTHAVVIPVYDENDHIAATLASVKAALQYTPEPVKILLVINEPVNAAADAQANDRELLKSLRQNDGKYDGGLAVGSELFFIDLTDKDIAKKFRTVGNARKAGFDGIIAANDGQMTEISPLFFSLDADTLVSCDYFEKAMEFFAAESSVAGAVFDFEHRCNEADEAVKTAVARYEYYLRDYVEKLKIAQSAYSFWTIGSAFVCRQTAYMRCGGMRRNAAGEDFYFLQALRKVGNIGLIPAARVYPAGRVSARVPFGTGPAIARQLRGEELKLYNEKSFQLLGDFFTAACRSTYETLSGNISDLMPPVVKEYLQSQNFENLWQKIVKNTPKNHGKLFEALQIYCDGFFILKFCHYLEEKYPEEFARMPIDIALQ